MQAISLTLRYVAFHLEELMLYGGRLLDSEGDDFPFSAYFPTVIQRSQPSDSEDPSP